MRFTPHKYQLEAIKFLVSHGAAALFLDPGLGKTSISLAAFETLRSKGVVKKALVLAPLRPAYSVWPGERLKWDEFSHLRVNVIHGHRKEEKLAAALRGESDIDVVNFEAIPWLFRHRLRTMGSQPWPWDVLIVDESTRLKDHKTLRFRTLRPYLPEFKRRFILTGTPAPNGLLDLFGQVYVLDFGRSLGQYITHYRNTYFNEVGFNWIPKAGAQEQIQEKLKPLALRMEAKDLIELPELFYNVVKVQLPDDARKIYDDMEEELVAELEGAQVIAPNAGVAWGKCRQIANGGLFHEGGEKWTHIHEAKVDAVEELIEELGGKPTLVAYEYRHDLDRLRGRLGVDTPYIGGGVPTSRFREIETAWNAGKIPVLLAQPQSVAHGLNLQGTGAAVIFAGLTPDLEVREQFIRRVWRQGQRERVGVHDIVAEGTVDEVILRMLAKKDRTQRSLLESLKSYLERSAA